MYEFIYPRYENCSHFWDFFRFFGGGKCSIFGVENIFETMFPYTEEYTESESDIQNNILLY